MSLNNAPILVLCDDPATAHALVISITQSNGDVVYASNWAEAHRQLKRFRFDAAVLDWQAGSDAAAGTLCAFTASRSAGSASMAPPWLGRTP